MVPADSRRISRVPRYSGYCYASHGFAYRTITVYGRSFQSVPLAIVHAMPQSYNPRPAVTGRVWALPRSLATTGGIIVIFFSCRYYTGLSHSDIRGSKVACTSPRLVAACHVLHRLREPRHPPYALIYFRNILSSVSKRKGVSSKPSLRSLVCPSCHRPHCPFGLTWRITDSNR